MTITADSLKADLAKLGSHAHRAEAARGRITDAAHQALTRAETRLGELRPKVVTDADAAAEYEALTLERGKLQNIIARG